MIATEMLRYLRQRQVLAEEAPKSDYRKGVLDELAEAIELPRGAHRTGVGVKGWRVLPRSFVKAYIQAFGEFPPDSLIEAYELMCEVLYEGVTRDSGLDHEIGKTSSQEGLWFGDWTLLAVKARADRILASTTTALQRWLLEGEGTRRRRRETARRSNLARARGQGRGPGSSGEA